MNKQFIVEGIKVVEELFEQDKFKIDTVYFTSDYDKTIPAFIQQQEVSKKELERISGLQNPNKLLAVVNQKTCTLNDLELDSAVLILDGLNDPGNLGTILRTADWYGIKSIILSDNSVEMFNQKVIQSSMGAIFRIDVVYDELEKAIDLLKKKKFDIVGAGLSRDNIYEYKFKQTTAIVMGSESHGISDKIRNSLDVELTIPKHGESESLNVGVATGIFIAEFKRQLSF